MAAVVMSPELVALFTRAKAPARFTDYLRELGVDDVLTFALMTEEEKGVKPDICDVANLDLKALEVISIKKAWIWARQEAMPTGGVASSSAPSAVEPAWPTGTEERLTTMWNTTHQFLLHGGRLVHTALMQKMYMGLKKGSEGASCREVGADPPQEQFERSGGRRYVCYQ